MTDLSKRMHFSPAAATGCVDRLVKLGYVVRHEKGSYTPPGADRPDRRNVWVEISPKGTDLVYNMDDKAHSDGSADTNNVRDAIESRSAAIFRHHNEMEAEAA